MKVLIVDDERDAIEAIENTMLLSGYKHNVIATSTNPLEAIGLILQHNPDLVFLDIEMPEMNGFEMLESIPKINFEVVFVTAYDQYAIQAIKNNAADYILKPVSVSDVKAALERVEKRVKNNQSSSVNFDALISDARFKGVEKIKISTSSGFELINLSELISLEAQGAYSYARLKGGKSIMITKPLKELEMRLNLNIFFRTHRSFIINLDHIKRFESERNKIIMSDNISIPLARRRMEEFKEKLNTLI
jgi:two-component system LytT family response regulator